MIPKIIHYCWLSNDPYPEKIKICMASWKKHLPDYEFMLWNFDRFDKNSSLWVKQAFEAKKYAFAADYIRLYALYYCGGIYLDIDVEVVKPFDDLLDLPYFFGKEDTHTYLNIIPIAADVIGAEKGCKWVGKCLEYYKDRKFVWEFGKYDMEVLPLIMYRILSENYSLKLIDTKDKIVHSEQEVFVLPIEYFCPKKENNQIEVSQHTYSIHHRAGSWTSQNRKEKLRQKISKWSSKIGFYKLYRNIFPKKNIENNYYDNSSLYRR